VVVNPVRVALVDDQELMRSGYRLVLDAQPDLTVVAEAGDGIEALDVLAVTRADVVLMDVRMPRLDGVETTRRLLARPHPPRVLVLTTFDLDEYAYAAIEAGASGFLLKDVPSAELVYGIRAVAAGDAIVAPSTTRRLLERFAAARPVDDGARLAVLTARERDVLTRVATGAGNAEIAADLVLSEATVKTHVHRILAKLGLRDRVQAVVLAYETGLVRPGEVSPRPDQRPGPSPGRPPGP
jgi:DNA-binding NarL/FixJ family response regulator